MHHTSKAKEADMSYHKMPNSKRNLRIYTAVAVRAFLAKGGTIVRYNSKGERI